MLPSNDDAYLNIHPRCCPLRHDMDDALTDSIVDVEVPERVATNLGFDPEAAIAAT